VQTWITCYMHKAPLPKMYYVELDHLRYQATNAVVARLGQAKPPLGCEVVEFMLDHGSNLWSICRSKTNFF
jgi:hypothetical protein